jgi:hypothetical protein
MSSQKTLIFGIGKEHGIPPVRIRYMTDKRFKELKKIWQGLGGNYLGAA